MNQSELLILIWMCTNHCFWQYSTVIHLQYILFNSSIQQLVHFYILNWGVYKYVGPPFFYCYKCNVVVFQDWPTQIFKNYGRKKIKCCVFMKSDEWISQTIIFIRKISINKMMFEQFLKEEIFIGYCKHIICTGSVYNI